MNAIIGDNGIITRAQEANIQSSIASLEEYLQLKYTENYEEMSQYKSKIEGLTNVYSGYFFIPANEGVGGLKYIVDSEGHALYLIKKSGLPEEIRESLVGGDAGEGKYPDYLTLNDVYGVTSNLKVYYCSGGADSIKGLAKENLDNDNPQREVFTADSQVAKELGNYDQNKDGIINAEEIKSVTSFTVDKDSGVTNLKDLYNFVNLNQLILDGITLNDLSGIENVAFLNYIYIKNCNIGDYSKIKSLANKLKYLYFYNITDDELGKACDTVKGIGGCDFSELEYFAVVGNESYICSDRNLIDENKSENKISTIKPFKTLSDATKKSIKYLSLQNNELTDIALLSDFLNVALLRIECNSIVSLNGLEKMNNLHFLVAERNKLGLNENYNVGLSNHGKDESTDSLSYLKNNSNLFFLDLRYNKIKWVDYISNGSVYSNLYLDNNVEFATESVTKIADTYNKVDSRCRSIDAKYLNYLTTSDILKYASLNLTDTSDEILYLETMSTDDKLKVKSLDLSGNPKLSNDKLVSILSSGFSNLVALDLDNCTNLNSLEFCSGMKELKQIDFAGTSVVGDSVSVLNDCTKIKTIECDNVNIDLKSMTPTLNRCQTGSDNYYTKAGYLGMRIINSELAKKLKDCTDLTNLYSAGLKFPDNLDLSNCSKLTQISLNSAPSGTLTLPPSIKVLYIFVKNVKILFKDSVNLKELSCDVNTGWDYLGDILFVDEEMTLKCDKFTLGCASVHLTFWNNVCELGEFSNVRIYRKLGTAGEKFFIDDFNNEKVLNVKNKLQIQDCSNLYSINNIKINNILPELEISGGNLNNLDGLEQLNDLVALNLNNNSISNLRPLSSLSKLSTLYLENNVIEDRTSYNDGESGTKVVNNLDILSNLNTTGSLRTLYLEGNRIIDFSAISGLQWAGRSGF